MQPLQCQGRKPHWADLCLRLLDFLKAAYPSSQSLCGLPPLLARLSVNILTPGDPGRRQGPGPEGLLEAGTPPSVTLLRHWPSL